MCDGQLSSKHLISSFLIGCIVTAAAGRIISAYNLGQTKIKKDNQEEISESIIECIGNTPLIRIKSLSDVLGVEILAKAEYLNPFGSPKDRVVKALVPSDLPRGTKVYEGTSGSTGISLAQLCRALGYEPHIVIPDDTSNEKKNLLAKCGAVLEIVKPASIVDRDMYVNKARTLAAENGGVFVDQFENDKNWHAHFDSTASEILSQCGGNVDAFVSGAGTGGTISGIAKYLQAHSKAKIFLADPQGSSLFNYVRYNILHSNLQNEGTRRRHQVDSIVEGIGLTRSTANFRAGAALINDAIRVSDTEAAKMTRWLRDQDGLFVGGSSGVNLVAAVRVAIHMRQNGKQGRIITTLCDGGERHLSKFWKEEIVVSSLDDILDPAWDDGVDVQW